MLTENLNSCVVSFSSQLCGMYLSHLFSKSCDLNDISSSKGLEALICSTLSSDITFFEKISSSAFRLRANLFVSRDLGQYRSCSESSDFESDCHESDSEESDTDGTEESGYEEQDTLNMKESGRKGKQDTGKIFVSIMDFYEIPFSGYNYYRKLLL